MNATLRRRVIYLLPLPVLFGSLLLGPSASAEAGKILSWGYGLLFREGAGGPEEALVGTIVWEVRLPRILLTFLVGAPWPRRATPCRRCFAIPSSLPTSSGSPPGPPSAPPWP